MRNRLMMVAAAVGVGCLALGPVSYADSDNIVYRAKVLGGAKANWGDTCADLLVPPAGVCDESYLTFYTHGDGKPLKDSTWFVFVETYRLTFDGINADPVDDFTLRSGFVQVPEGSFAVDTARLGSASLDVSIPMDDGTVYDFEGTWLATGERVHFGNDGPEDSGIPDRHYNDACLTYNHHRHQDFRWSEMTGTLNGHPVHSYTWADGLAAIFQGHYMEQYVEHGGCAR